MTTSCQMLPLVVALTVCAPSSSSVGTYVFPSRKRSWCSGHTNWNTWASPSTRFGKKCAYLRTSSSGCRCLPLWLGQAKCTKQELLSLISILSLACKVVHPGRIYLCWLIDLSTTVAASRFPRRPARILPAVWIFSLHGTAARSSPRHLSLAC